MIHTLCWDCAHATDMDERAENYCEWAVYLKPVPGWTAHKTVKKEGTDDEMHSYIVMECPKFKRDAFGGGLKWLRETSEN